MKTKIISIICVLLTFLCVCFGVSTIILKNKQTEITQNYISQQFSLAAEAFSLCDEYGEYIQATSYLYSASNELIMFDDRETSDKIVFYRLWQYAAAYPDNVKRNSERIISAMRSASEAMQQGKSKKQALSELDKVYENMSMILEACVNE